LEDDDSKNDSCSNKNKHRNHHNHQYNPNSAAAAEELNLMGRDAVRCYKGKYVVYVGEWKDQTTRGCIFGETGGEHLQNELSANFKLIKRIAIPNWPFSSDDLQLWRRKKRGDK